MADQRNSPISPADADSGGEYSASDEPVARRRRPHVPLYCLHCYAELQHGKNACPDCGRSSPRFLRTRYWSLDPALVRRERSLKAMTVILCVVLMAAMLLLLPHGLPSAGWLLAISLFLGIALWETISALTRKLIYFKPSRFWTIFFCLCALVVFVYMFRLGAAPLSLPAAVACLLAALLSWKCGHWFAAWKLKQIRGFSVSPDETVETEAQPPPNQEKPD